MSRSRDDDEDIFGVPGICGRCGRVHRFCKAHNREGLPCGRGARDGMEVCKSHGGGNPQAVAKVAQRKAEEQAARDARNFGYPIEVDPKEALLSELHMTFGVVQWIREQVNTLGIEDIVWGTTKVEEGVDRGDSTDLEISEAGINLWVQLWQKERKHLLDVTKACIAAGIEERRVRIAEQQGVLLASVVKAVLDRLALTPDQQAQVATVVPEELRRAQLHAVA